MVIYKQNKAVFVAGCCVLKATLSVTRMYLCTPYLRIKYKF